MNEDTIIETTLVESNESVSSPATLPNLDISDVAKLGSNGEDISAYVPNNTTDNMKAFLLLYARSQLTRVIKLTDALSLLEDKLINDATNNVDKYTPDQLMRMFSTIQGSLTSAIGLIKQVSTEDTYYQVIVNNTNNTISNTMINEVTNMSAVSLKSQDSREKVREVARMLLNNIEKSS